MKNFVVCLGLICALLGFFAQDAYAKKGQREKDTRDGGHKILHMPPLKIAEFVTKTKGDRRIVFIYTSWCPYCRKAMPKIMDLENVRPGSIIAVSEDEDHVKFVSYINKYPKIPFMIFLSFQRGQDTLAAALQKTIGAKPWKGFPHAIFLDADNTIVAEGNYTPEDMAAFIFGGSQQRDGTFAMPDDTKKAE